MWTSVWDRIQSNPVLLTEAIRQTILTLVLFGLVHWDEHQIAGMLMSVSAILSLVARGSTVASNKVEERVDQKVAYREMSGTTGTGNGMEKKP